MMSPDFSDRHRKGSCALTGRPPTGIKASGAGHRLSVRHYRRGGGAPRRGLRLSLRRDWRGVREGVGSWQALEAFRARAPHRRVSVEITEGLPPRQLFDGELPEEVEIIYRGRSLGVVRVPEASKPWAEALATAIGTQCTSSTALLFDALGHHP